MVNHITVCLKINMKISLEKLEAGINIIEATAGKFLN